MVLIDSCIVGSTSILATWNTYPNNVNSPSARGQTFETDGGCYKLTSCQFELKKTGNPNGTMKARLYKMTANDLGDGGKPSNDVFPTITTPLAVSDPVDIAVLTGVLQWITFTFSGAEQYELEANTCYCICWMPETGSFLDEDNYIQHSGCVASVCEGNGFLYQNGQWGGYTAPDTKDRNFKIYGDVIACEEDLCGPLINSYDETHHDNSIDIKRSYYCHDVGKVCAVGQCFKTPMGQRYEPCSAKFYLRRKGQPTGMLWVNFYEIDGTCGTDCIPLGEGDDNIICQTNWIDAMSIANTFTLYEFNVIKGCACLEANKCYGVAVIGWGGFDDNNLIEVGIEKVGSHAGNTFYYTTRGVGGSGWVVAPQTDTIFYVYGIPCGSAHEGGDAPVAVSKAEQEGPRKIIWYNTEHLVLHTHSSLGKNIEKPCWIRGFIGRLAQPIVVVVKAGLGIPAFFETVVKAGIKRAYEETLHLQSKLGIKYAETLVMKEDVRGYLLAQKVVMKNFQESLINFMESLSKKQYEAKKDMELHKKKQKKKDKLRELYEDTKDV